MINLLGYTLHQQAKKDKELQQQGSLWGRFPILYKFDFTKKELGKVEQARKTIEDFKKKLEEI